MNILGPSSPGLSLSGRVRVLAIDTETLGDRSYLATDGEVALVVDPQRDIDRVLSLASQLGVRVTHVAETHLHNDYITGGLALARVTGSHYLVPEDAAVAFDRRGASDGDRIEISPVLALWVIATPGHTFHHVAYALEAGREPVGVFSGGSLLHGSVGRTDLVAPEHTNALAHAQYASVRRLAELLPGPVPLYPTHGFGSFCAATHSADVRPKQAAWTIGAEARSNTAFTQAEDDFVTCMLAGLDEFPAYYAYMGPANAAGPAAADLSPPATATPAELRRRLAAGEWVVDLRQRRAFASTHLAGTINCGLDGPMATYVAWLAPRGTPVTLLGEGPGQVAEAQRELVRVGIERPAGSATGSPSSWGEKLQMFPTATFADLACAVARPGVVVLDVRRNLEWKSSHIRGAVHIPVHELLRRLDEVPGGEVWAHCAGGYRASIAASVLQAAGRQVVAVDDDYDAHASLAGLAQDG
jgi:hydroxyacylglutathione hydrolase